MSYLKITCLFRVVSGYYIYMYLCIKDPNKLFIALHIAGSQGLFLTRTIFSYFHFSIHFQIACTLFVFNSFYWNLIIFVILRSIFGNQKVLRIYLPLSNMRMYANIYLLHTHFVLLAFVSSSHSFIHFFGFRKSL